jgi:hypothetical protein
VQLNTDTAYCILALRSLMNETLIIKSMVLYIKMYFTNQWYMQFTCPCLDEIAFNDSSISHKSAT